MEMKEGALDLDEPLFPKSLFLSLVSRESGFAEKTGERERFSPPLSLSTLVSQMQRFVKPRRSWLWGLFLACGTMLGLAQLLVPSSHSPLSSPSPSSSSTSSSSSSEPTLTPPVWLASSLAINPNQPHYLMFAPLAAYATLRRFHSKGLQHYRALTLLLTSEASSEAAEAEAFARKWLARAGATVVPFSFSAQGVRDETIVQTARLCAASTPPVLAESGSFVITTDADIVMLRTEAFSDVLTTEKDIFLWQYEWAKKRGETFPMCYVGMSDRKWREVTKRNVWRQGKGFKSETLKQKKRKPQSFEGCMQWLLGKGGFARSTGLLVEMDRERPFEKPRPQGNKHDGPSLSSSTNPQWFLDQLLLTSLLALRSSCVFPAAANEADPRPGVIPDNAIGSFLWEKLGQSPVGGFGDGSPLEQPGSKCWGGSVQHFSHPGVPDDSLSSIHNCCDDWHVGRHHGVEAVRAVWDELFKYDEEARTWGHDYLAAFAVFISK